MGARKVDRPQTMADAVRNTRSVSDKLGDCTSQSRPLFQASTAQKQSNVGITKKIGRPRTISDFLQAQKEPPLQPHQQSLQTGPNPQLIQPPQLGALQPPQQPPLQPETEPHQQSREPTMPSFKPAPQQCPSSSSTPSQPTPILAPSQPQPHQSRRRRTMPSVVQEPQPQQCPSSSYAPLQPTSISDNSGPIASELPTKKRGRGRAKGIKNWGTGVKLQVKFDKNFSPLGPNGTMLKGQLGIMVKNGYRVPLTYVDWTSVPDIDKEDIWSEVKDNLEFCPEEFKKPCMEICNKIWKDNKSKIKNDHYKPYMPPVVPVPDPRVQEVPDSIVPNQWLQLIEYWGLKKDQAIANSKNREARGPLQNTGRTHFADIRNEMAPNGESLDKMSVFMRTRNPNDPDVKDLVAEYNCRVDELPETERTIETRDQIFHQLMGSDNHGYCRTYGGGVPRSAVYNTGSSSQATGPSSLAEIEKRMRESVFDVESRLTQRIATEIDKIKVQMFEYMESRGSDASRQVHDASSGHRACRDSVGDGLSPLEPNHTTTPPPIQRLNEQVIGVYLLSSGIPKEDVGEGLLITTDPMSEMDGKPLGEGYCKVFVEKAEKPNARLERPRQGLRTVGDAVGRHVAWRYSDVIEKEMDD